MRLVENHSMLGEDVIYTWTNRQGIEREVRGKVTGVEDGYVIRNIKTGKRYPAIRMRIKPNDGSRAIWSGTVREIDNELAEQKS